MCGFVGVVALNEAPIDAAAIRQMSSTLRHRGPDDDDIYVAGSIGFGFRRLSILDLSPAGHQPMYSEDGQTVLVFNGEIYNYIELRKELRSLGHDFKSSGDTEVLLHAYLEWGQECLDKLNGMWAFLIHDKRRGKIFGSRDRFGEKPLYHYRSGDFIFLSSEIKAILASGHYCGGPNWGLASRFLLNGSLDYLHVGRQTFYSGIEQFPAGSAFELDLRGRLSEWQYWSLADCLSGPAVSNPAESYYEIFEDALRLRLRSDVPVGIFLSGGLDSTSMICTLAKMRNGGGEFAGPLLAFSYQAKGYDESAYITDTVTQTGATLIPFSPDSRHLWNNLEQVLWYQDEPVHSMSAVITFELSRLVSAHGIKVILNGGGPDESLAGYHSLFSNYWYTLLRAGHVRDAWHEICAYCGAHGGDARTFFCQILCNQLKTAMGRIRPYRELGRWKHSRELRRHSWFTPALSDQLPMDNYEYCEPTLDSVVKRLVECAPLPFYLRVEDRNSMAHSIEARMPYLDHRLVSFAFRLPPNWKMRGPWNKYVMREAMRHRIPESVRTRLDKMGFPAPVRNWFATALFEPMQDLLGSSEARERGIYNVAAIRRALELHRQGKCDVSTQLFNVDQFET